MAGCSSLPPGAAPTGPIVTPRTYPETFSAHGAENYFVTALAAFCLSELSAGTTVGVRSVSDTDAIPEHHLMRVVAATSQTAQLVVTREDAATYLLESKVCDARPVRWEMRLIRKKDRHVVWSDKVFVENRRRDSAP